MEHYCTLFDRGFLPQGIALLRSLKRHAGPFTLWVLSLDEDAAQALEALKDPSLRVLRLSECETPALQAARANRTYGEYCWTLGCHVFSFVFDRDGSVERLTYIDADVYFAASPGPFFREMEAAGKDVLITEHAYAPRYAHYVETAGRFCVQFVTFTRAPKALALLERWQGQTRESCSNVFDQKRFGDQQYLDEWPEKFGELVHVLDHRFRTLAPWNADHAFEQEPRLEVVLFHFHTFRILPGGWLQWGAGYPLRHPKTRALYRAYQAEIESTAADLRRLGFPLSVRPFRPGFRGTASMLRSWTFGRLTLVRAPALAS